MYLWTRKNWLNWLNILDSGSGIFPKDSSTLRVRTFFNNYARIAEKNRISSSWRLYRIFWQGSPR